MNKIIKLISAPILSFVMLIGLTSVGNAETTVSAEVGFIFNTIFFLMSIYILGIVTKFISSIRELSIENQQDLKAGWRPRSIPFVYY